MPAAFTPLAATVADASRQFTIAAGLDYDPDTHTYRHNGRPLPGVTRVLDEARIVDVSGIPAAKLETARDRGVKLHLALQFLLEGDLDLDGLDPVLVPYVTAFEQWRDEVGFEPELALLEKPLCDPTLGFAGTPDWPGHLRKRGGVPVYVDGKAVYAMRPGYGPQTAAYRHLLKVAAGFEAVERIGLQLKPDGTFLPKPYTQRTDWNVFHAALSLYHWRANEGLVK